MVNLVKSELAQRRKVIVYPRQTGTRDIRGRLKQILAAHGMNGVSVLDSSVPTRKRLKWLRKNAKPVLITNPRLVETGMNLHDYGYCTILFYEIEYSLYTLWQACRRTWRLGQTRPVKVVYAVYAGAMESKALALMGRKMKAAQLLYGDEVGGAIVPEESGDFLTELAREVLEGKQLPDLQTLFADDDEMTDAAIGGLPLCL